VSPDSAPPASRAVLDRLSALHPKVIDLSLGRIERLLRSLGRPQDVLPPVVHVAGTNGKGSTVAFLRAMLEAAGLTVHVYTSPHLVRFSERIVIAGREIDDVELITTLEECERVNAGQPITVFEITTAAALLAFARTPAEITLLETGLGGRLDATNVVAEPALTAITPVSLDHQSFLGDSIAAIAFEKAGILKQGVPCVLAAQPPEAAAVIRARAAAVGSRLIKQGNDWDATTAADGRLLFHSENKVLALPIPGLQGAHQVQNAGVAVACARHLAGVLSPRDASDSSRRSVPEPGTTPRRLNAAAIARGLETVRWPARLQHLVRGELAALLPEDWELWLDGGHNPGAADVLARHLAGWRDRPVHLVFGMLRSKDVDSFLAPLAPAVARLAAVAIPGEEGSLSATETAAVALRHGIAATPAVSVADALRRLALAAGQPARVLICGSLYLAGSVLAANGDERLM
jgi:dihydrofolate synthase/folylpolyglutamate synthase